MITLCKYYNLGVDIAIITIYTIYTIILKRNILNYNYHCTVILYKVDQSSLALPRTTLINARSNSTLATMKAYAVYASAAAKAIRDAIRGGTEDADIEQDVEHMIQFEMQLAKVNAKLA